MDIPKAFKEIVNLYQYEIIDDLTIKHLNAHLQAKFPGKYRVYSTAQDEIKIIFDFTPEEYTWWALKYS